MKKIICKFKHKEGKRMKKTVFKSLMVQGLFVVVTLFGSSSVLISAEVWMAGLDTGTKAILGADADKKDRYKDKLTLQGEREARLQKDLLASQEKERDYLAEKDGANGQQLLDEAEELLTAARAGSCIAVTGWAAKMERGWHIDAEVSGALLGVLRGIDDRIGCGTTDGPNFNCERISGYSSNFVQAVVEAKNNINAFVQEKNQKVLAEQETRRTVQHAFNRSKDEVEKEMADILSGAAAKKLAQEQSELEAIGNAETHKLNEESEKLKDRSIVEKMQDNEIREREENIARLGLKKVKELLGSKKMVIYGSAIAVTGAALYGLKLAFNYIKKQMEIPAILDLLNIKKCPDLNDLVLEVNLQKKLEKTVEDIAERGEMYNVL
ncbi:hypothetical protein KAU11_03820, partial [Candidatus Babeliales bacterium]|nr:hypothetical protein [Candidatus Babeliales bacterium]